MKRNRPVNALQGVDRPNWRLTRFVSKPSAQGPIEFGLLAKKSRGPRVV
jgi:hypothetical protein